VSKLLEGTACSRGKTASIVALDLGLGPMASAATFTSAEVSDSLWIEQNLRESVFQSLAAYSDVAPASQAAFMSGMTSLEQQVFTSGACEIDLQLATYGAMPGGGGGGGGPDLMSIHRIAGGGCGKAAALGCGANVLLQWRNHVSAARWGAFYGGAGAAGAAIGSVLLECGLGAFAGYMVCHYT